MDSNIETATPGKEVIAMVVDNTTVMIYFVDGSTKSLPTDVEHSHHIVKKVNAALNANQKIFLKDSDFTGEPEINIYEAVEKKISGIRFFRAIKSALFGSNEKIQYNKIESILLPVGKHYDLKEDETLVAVIEPEKPDEPVAVLTDVQHLAPQVEHVANGGDPAGLQAFMRRAASVAFKRRHSVEDLLAFLSKNDLPITDDGCIIAYKRLVSVDNYYVDTHSRSVKQKIGSKVMIDESQVDPDRRNECSYGLHVGRRDYMRSFSGDTIFLVKVAPEDVIAVPNDYGRAKMRCCAYHVLGTVNGKGFEDITKNKSMTDNNKGLAYFLGNIIAGNHVPVKETVKINKDKTLTITPVDMVVDLRDQAASPTAVALNGPVEAVQEEPEEQTTLELDVVLEPKEQEPEGATKAATSVSEEAKPKGEPKATAQKKNKKKVKPVKTLNIDAGKKPTEKKVDKIDVKSIAKKTTKKQENTDLSKSDINKLMALKQKVDNKQITKVEAAKAFSVSPRTFDRWLKKHL